MTDKSLKYWQWRTIVVTMIGYAMFYLVRKNFALSMPGLQADFGISKVQLGLFLTLNGVIYGLSRFVVGIMTDRGSARKIMSLGLLLCGVVNICFGLSDKAAQLVVGLAAKYGTAWTVSSVMVYLMGFMWLVNGFLQGMGVPPCTKTIAQWIHPSELATKMSVWNMSHSIGAGLAMGLCGWIIMPHLGMDMSGNAEIVSQIAANLQAAKPDVAVDMDKVMDFAAHWCAWRWCFIIPAFVAIFGSLFLFASLVDSPSDVGLPEVVGKKKAIVQSDEDKAEYKVFVKKHVFRNPVIWILAVTNFFVYIVRFACLDWGPTLLTEAKGMTLASATTVCVVFELLGGNLGMLFWGWATDHVFKNKAHHTSLVCMLCAVLAIAAFYIIPETAPWWVMMIPFTLIGFCIYGPQALLGICAVQHATNRASATANGILGIFGYASTIISGVVFGWIAQNWGWNLVFTTMIAVSLLAAGSLALIFKAKATGYDEEPVKSTENQ